MSNTQYVFNHVHYQYHLTDHTEYYLLAHVSLSPSTPLQNLHHPQNLFQRSDPSLFSFQSEHSPKMILSIPMASAILTQIYTFILDLFLNSKSTLSTAYQTSPGSTSETAGEALHQLEMAIRETMIPLEKNETEWHPSKYTQVSYSLIKIMS